MKAEDQIKESCCNVLKSGVTIEPGPWFRRTGKSVTSCCPMGAVLMDRCIDFEHLTIDQYVSTVCSILDVDQWWCHRFWMGFDRGYQIHFEVAVNNAIKLIKDDVSGFGLRFRRIVGSL